MLYRCHTIGNLLGIPLVYALTPGGIHRGSTGDFVQCDTGHKCNKAASCTSGAFPCFCAIAVLKKGLYLAESDRDNLGARVIIRPASLHDLS